MKIYRLLLFIISSVVLIGCDGSGKPAYKYTKQETNQFLDEIVKNAKVTIGNITEIEKQPTDELYIVTRYPLSKEKLDEYNKNNHSLKNKDNDISDFATYIFKGYNLVNEKNEKLQFVDKGRAVYLREGGLWEHNNVLCENLAIDIELNKTYERLKGYITIEFEMPGNIFGRLKREVKIPVNMTIYDKVPE
ncbi:hypothetical protein [Pedobacter panaciterrae]|jgi:hypothetical protein|uniref:Lipoprotein n=1 Tax=Pedobacter panaciterrae TaxID=363849 RepID=A0ABU8NFN9_9SPHI|nr:hypothetical protein [Pedobacter panaciterrae]NQX56733.1 hypothetical protein [Pedobacter panaciterrae]